MVPPLCKWAQRTNLVFVTVCLEDCKDPEIKVEEDKLYFRGIGGTDKKEHEVTLEFFGKIDTEVTSLTQFKSYQVYIIQITLIACRSQSTPSATAVPSSH